MNELARKWLAEEADPRVHGTVKEVVWVRFIREAPTLGSLPTIRYDTAYHETRLGSWDGYIDVRGNRYSIPDEVRGRMVRIRLTLDGFLTVYDKGTVVAEHILKSPAAGWVTQADHHTDLWRSLHVERRDLSVYEEVAQCN